MKNSEIKWSVLAAVAMASFLLATGGVAGDDREPPSSRIIGGNQARPGEFPFMAGLTIFREDSIGGCGCSIIDRRHVLTAAHCVTKKDTIELLDPSDLRVRVGCHLRTECSSTHAVSRVMAHHAWNWNKSNDIAVLRLEEEIEFNSLTGLGAVNSIHLAPRGDLCCDKSAEKLTAIGWGRTKRNQSVPYTNPLLKVSLDSYPLDKCKRTLEIPDDINKIICTRTSGKKTCKGDSGGPLIRELPWAGFILVGVTSFGNPDCNPDKGSAFTKVSAFRDWIEQCTDDGTCQAL